MRFILFFADVLLTNMLCNILINETFYNMGYLWLVLFLTHIVPLMLHMKFSLVLKSHFYFINISSPS